MLFAIGFPGAVWAAVGQAERYDEVQEANLAEFQEKLIREEQSAQMDHAVQALEALEGAQAGDEQYQAEMETLKKELLKIPDRDRFEIGLDGQYTYESNIERNVFGEEKGDSVFDNKGYMQFDLGGRKTDIRFELRGAHQANIRHPKSNYWNVEERIRYRRKYFRKITHSVHSRISRHTSRTIEIDKKKIRWDSHQNMNFNWAFSRKLSMNMELTAIKRLFTTEPFDNDSMWEVGAAPSAFWNITPKSRLSVGYSVKANRIRSKTGDANSHEIHMQYFGQVTRKSSISFDLAASHQSPRSLDTPVVNTYTIGKGFMWQMTPKTQMTLQAIRQLQNSTSNDVAGGLDNEVSKGDVHYTHDSFSVSFNSLLNPKLTAILNMSVSYQRTKMARYLDSDPETRQLSFPLSLTLNYMVKRYMQLRLRYAFAYRMGDEKTDRYRDHAILTGFNFRY